MFEFYAGWLTELRFFNEASEFFLELIYKFETINNNVSWNFSIEKLCANFLHFSDFSIDTPTMAPRLSKIVTHLLKRLIVGYELMISWCNSNNFFRVAESAIKTD